jgi:hypothetical protein
MAMSKHVVRVVVVFAVIGAVAAVLYGAEQAPEYQVKAEFIERFTRFIDWPAGSESRGNFHIGVIGDNPFNGYLDKMAALHKIHNRTVQIHAITDLSQIDSCQLLFIGASERERLKRILAHTESKPILTIGDTNGYAAAGVIINFYTVGENVRFEVNEGAIERSGLKVSAKLLKLAKIVEQEGAK